MRHLLAGSTLCLVALSVAAGQADKKSALRAHRFESQIRAYEAADRKEPPPKGAVLFLGSSSIRLWKVKNNFPDLVALNRGFGGSQIADSIHFAERIVFPYEPKVIVFYAGDNDIAGGKSPERVAADFRAFASKVHGGIAPDQDRLHRHQAEYPPLATRGQDAPGQHLDPRDHPARPTSELRRRRRSDAWSRRQAPPRTVRQRRLASKLKRLQAVGEAVETGIVRPRRPRRKHRHWDMPGNCLRCATVESPQPRCTANPWSSLGEVLGPGSSFRPSRRRIKA